MSEPAVKLRQPIDLDEFERRLRGPAPVSRGSDDPLAELARLVGSDSPFGLRQAQSAPAPAVNENNQEAPREAPDLRGPYAPEAEAPAYAEDQPSHDHLQAEMVDLQSLEADVQQYAAEAAAEAPALRATREAPVLHFPEDVADDPFADQPFEAEERPVRRSRRMVYLASAALILIFGGVGVVLVTRGGVKLGGPAPTIMAAQGPVKVQPANPGGADLPNQSSSVIDRGGVDHVGVSKVITREEQPVDLMQAAKAAAPRDTDSAAGSAPGAPSVAVNGFPEPKRVKTVSVRPDGTIISADGAPVAVASPPVGNPFPSRSIASIPLNPSSAKPTPVPAAAPPAPPPTTAAVRPSTAPAATPPAAPKTTTRIASVKPDTNLSDTKPVSAPPKPPVAAAKPASGAGGSFAVQLAAPGSEQEAKDVIARLQKRFASELGARHPSAAKVNVGEKSVYRVRVGNLSKEDADSLCGSIKSGGGACFVARN
jgi:hypothetical protein